VREDRGSDAGSYLRLIDSCITQLKAQGASRTCNESKEEEEGRGRTVAETGPSHRSSIWWNLIQRSGFRIQGLGFKIQGLGFRVQGFGFRVQCFGFRGRRGGITVWS